MYCYWLNAPVFEFKDKLTSWLKINSFPFTAKKALTMQEWFELSREEDYHTELQLFEVEDRWLIRIISNSYIIENNLAEFPELVPCVYDNRSDMTPEEEQNEKYAKIADELIDRQHYYLVPVINEKTIFNFGWDKLANQGQSAIINE